MSWSPPPFDVAQELRDHLPPAGWLAAAEAICARHALDTTGLAPFATGSDVVFGTDRHVVKLTAPYWAWQLEAEAQWLRFVEGRLGLATPKLLERGELAGWPYVVMSRVSGEALGTVWPRLARGERLRLAGDLGRLTRELHGLDVADLPDTWELFWEECRTELPERHEAWSAPPGVVEAIAPFLAAAAPLEQLPHVLLHTELLDQHVLLERRGERYELSALIDFADARVGPAEYEFAAVAEFIFRGEPGLLRSFLLAYGHAPERLTPEYSERLLAWALSHRYSRLARMFEQLAPTRPSSLGALARTLFGV